MAQNIDTYKPLIDAAINNDENGYTLLTKLGVEAFKADPGLCRSSYGGVKVVLRELCTQCRDMKADTFNKVRAFYKLDDSWCAYASNQNSSILH